MMLQGIPVPKYLSLLCLLVLLANVLGFTTPNSRAHQCWPSSTCRQRLPPPSFPQQSTFGPEEASRIPTLMAKKENEDEEESSLTGMNEAFRQLDALGSLFDDDDDDNSKEQKSSSVQLDQESKAALGDTGKASLEEEAKLFQSMLKDSEQDESELYSDVMKDIGGTPKEKSSPKVKREPSVIVQDIIRGNALGNDGKDIIKDNSISIEDKEQFLNQAIQEAMEEARNMSPESKKSLSDSILDDEEIMKEIEEIFEKGNEKLLASLEEIRQEQKALAKTSAEQSAKVKMDQMGDDADRFALAEASMVKQLKRVNQETKEVERAVEDLKRAQAEMDADPLLRLTSGNILKPAALAGVLLFSVRSVLDLIAMGGADSEAHLTAALIQLGIAFVCGIYLALF